MKKATIIQLVTDAASILNDIPAGRVDSVRGAVYFQVEVSRWRELFIKLLWRLQDEDEKGAREVVEQMRQDIRRRREAEKGTRVTVDEKGNPT